MLNSIKLLESKVHEYNALKNTSQIDWKVLLQILCLLGEIILQVANELPDRLKWLKSILLLVGELLKSVCSTIKEEDVKR